MLRKNVLDMPFITRLSKPHWAQIHRSSVSVTALHVSLPWNLFHHVKANTHLVNG